jgi:PST family polysaccharide transporter
LCLSAVVVFPALAIIGIIAPELMSGVFGPQWLPAAAPLQVLCVAGAYYCIYNLADSLVRATGAVYEKCLYQTLYFICVLGGAFVGARWSITGVAVGVLAATIVGYLLMARLSLKLTDTGWWPFLLAQLPGLAVAASTVAVGMPAAVVLRGDGLPPLAVLAGVSLAAGITAAATALVLPARWFSASVRGIIVGAKKHVFEALTAARRRYQPEAI